MPPKLTVSFGSFLTAMISGWSSKPRTNGYSIGSPIAPGEGHERVTVEMLVAEEHHEVPEPGGADLRHRLVVEIVQVHAADLRTERAGDRRDGDAAVLGGRHVSSLSS